MKAVRFNLFGTVAILALILVIVDVKQAQQREQSKDSLGGASLLFKSPQNPPTHHRKNQQRSSAAAAEENNSASLPSKTKYDRGDKVEDALALGNTARNRRPPDFASAEKAYRLAWKLNPTDPRSFVGLGNLYFDQQRYPEAATAYKAAIKLGGTMGNSKRGSSVAKSGTREIHPYQSNETGEWHVYLATVMLQQGNLTGAEIELRQAVAIDPRKAIWRAQLGYGLFSQTRYTEASALFEAALQLDPNNEKYKDLLRQSRLKAQVASAQDDATTKRMEGTKWEIREAGSSSVKGSCRLEAGQRLDCKLNSNKRLLYAEIGWKIQDGLFELIPASASATRLIPEPHGSSCIGTISADRIHLKCPLPESERREVWTKQDRD